MIRLRSLGQCVVESDSSRIVPDSGVLFAIALYVLGERSRRVSRSELEELIWPEADEPKAGHCLRQAVYRLKAVGINLSTERAHLVLTDDVTEVDYASLLTARDSKDAERLSTLIRGPFLPGYVAAYSDRYREWVDRQRDIANAAARRVLVAAIAAKRARHEWNEVEDLAKRCLAIDSLNEEATFAIAEASAMHGSKAYALTILDKYLHEIGPDAREIRLPATLLRRRISESRPTTSPIYIGQTKFVGREDEMETLNQHLDRALAGQGSAHLVWGEPGIGKTRLVTEFARAAELRGVRIVKGQAQSHDERRAMSLFVDIIPQLLRLPGALGASPESMAQLKSLCEHSSTPDQSPPKAMDPEYLYSALRRAVFDLFDAILAEQPLIVIAEDVHWSDPDTRSLLADVARWTSTRRMLLAVTARSEAHSAADWKRLNASLASIKLAPLTSEKSRLMLSTSEAAIARGAAPETLEWCVETSAGNPFYLTELFLHSLKGGGTSAVPSSLSTLIADRLARLAPTSRRLLQVCAVLGKRSTMDGVQALLGIEPRELLDALDEAEANGLIEPNDGSLYIRHELLRQGIGAQMSESARRLLHHNAAILLEKELSTSEAVSLLWDCAEHWRHAGEPSRAVRLLEAAADHAMKAGFAAQAIEPLELALQIGGNSNVGIALKHAQACAASDYWPGVLASCGLAVTAADENTRIQGAILQARANFQTGWDSSIPELLALLDGRISPRLAVAVAIETVLLAYHQFDLETIHLVYTRVANARDSSGVAATDRATLDLYYHGTVGEVARVGSLASQLMDLARSSADMAILLRASFAALQAAHLLGESAEVVRVGNDIIELALRLGIPSRACIAAYRVASYHLDCGDLVAAQSWYSRALELEPEYLQPTERCSMGYTCARLAYYAGNDDEAFQWLQSESRRIASGLHGGRGRRELCVKVLQFLVDHHRSIDSLTEERCLDIVNTYELRKNVRIADELALAAYLALSRLGSPREARRLVVDYVAQQRKDLTPLSPQLRELLDPASELPRLVE